jgi:hypothetical protein
VIVVLVNLCAGKMTTVVTEKPVKDKSAHLDVDQTQAVLILYRALINVVKTHAKIQQLVEQMLLAPFLTIKSNALVWNL